MDKNIILQKAKNLQNYLVKIRRYLHENPEIGFELENTKNFIKKELEKNGLEVNEIGKCGLYCVIGGKKEGKTFLLRADTDALPIKEESDVPFKSKNEYMHACGHDMHTAMLIGAGILLKALENEIYGTVKLLFQPAEEILQGSKNMIESGILKNPTVDYALMIHVMANIPLKPGTAIAASPGASAPSADYFKIEVKGKGTHGSMPNLGVDSLLCASQILLSLQEISTREIPFSKNMLLTIGKLNGGTAPNIIAENTEMEGSIRCNDEETRDFAKKRVKEITQYISKAHRTESKVTFTGGCPTLVNDEKLSNSLCKYLKELLGNDGAFSVNELAKKQNNGNLDKTSGSEDFSYISHEVPSVMVALCAGEPKDGYCYPQHHSKVKFDETALSFGSAVYAYGAIRFLEENS